MTIHPIGAPQSFIAAKEIKIENKTTAKVADTAKNLFKKAVFWSAVAIGLVFSFSIIKTAFANPITAIVLCMLGVWAYKNKEKITSFVKIHMSALKEKLGVSNKEIFCKVTDNILTGEMPTTGNDYLKALKEADVKTVISIMHHDQSLYNTWISKPILSHEFTKQDIDYLPIKIEKPKELSIEEMHFIADILHKKAQDEKKVYIYGDLDSYTDLIGILSYLIKYENITLEDALTRLEAIKPDLKVSDSCLGTLFRFYCDLKKGKTGNV